LKIVKNTNLSELDSFQGNQVGLYLNNVYMIFNDDQLVPWINYLFYLENLEFSKSGKSETNFGIFGNSSYVADEMLL
jgi:hypothetical protein